MTRSRRSLALLGLSSLLAIALDACGGENQAASIAAPEGADAGGTAADAPDASADASPPATDAGIDVALTDVARVDSAPVDATTDAPPVCVPDQYTNSTCAPVPIILPNISKLDFDVSFDGALTYAGVDGTDDVRVGCLNADGTTRRADFVAGSDSVVYSLRVHRARASGTSVVMWNRINTDWPSVGTHFYNRFVVLDSACSVIAGPANVESDAGRLGLTTTARSDHPSFDVADDGRFVSVIGNFTEWRMITRDPSGAAVGAVSFDHPAGCTGFEYTDVAMHSTTGEIALSCADDISRKRYVRRFASNLAAQTGWLELSTLGGPTNDFGTLGFFRASSDVVFLGVDDETPPNNVLYQLTSGGILSSVVGLGQLGLTRPGRAIWDSAGALVFASKTGAARVASGPTLVASEGIAELRLDGQERVYTLDVSGHSVKRGAFAF